MIIIDGPLELQEFVNLWFFKCIYETPIDTHTQELHPPSRIITLRKPRLLKSWVKAHL